MLPLHAHRWFRVFLFGVAALGPFSLNAYKACLPWVQRDFQASLPAVQLSLSLSILGSAVVTFFAGYAADHLGRRPVLGASLLAYVGGCVLGAVALRLEVLIVGRVLLAAASSVALVTGRSLVHDAYGEHESAPVIARITLQALLLVVLAPVLGGVLIDALGWRSVFWATGFLGAALGWLALTRLSSGAAPRAAHGPSGLGASLRSLLSNRVFCGFALQSSLHFAAFFAFASAASYLVVNELHGSATDFGLWLIVPAVCVGVGLKTAERLSGLVRSGPLALAGSVLVLLGSVVFRALLASGSFSAHGLFLSASLSALGIGLALPATNAGVMSAAPELAGSASGLLGLLQYTFAAVFAQVVASDEPRTASVLAALGLAGGLAAVASGLLSLNHGRRPAPA